MPLQDVMLSAEKEEYGRSEGCDTRYDTEARQDAQEDEPSSRKNTIMHHVEIDFGIFICELL